MRCICMHKTSLLFYKSTNDKISELNIKMAEQNALEEKSSESSCSSSSTEGSSVSIGSLEIGGRMNPFIADAVNSEFNFRPNNNPKSGNAAKPVKPQLRLRGGEPSVRIGEFRNTGEENPVIGRAEDSTFNFYGQPKAEDCTTVLKKEKDQGQQSSGEEGRGGGACSGEEGSGGGACSGKEGSGGGVCSVGRQAHGQPVVTSGVYIGHMKITGEKNPVIMNARGSTFNM